MLGRKFSSTVIADLSRCGPVRVKVQVLLAAVRSGEHVLVRDMRWRCTREVYGCLGQSIKERCMQ